MPTVLAGGALHIYRLYSHHDLLHGQRRSRHGSSIRRRLSWYHTGTATRLSRHLLEARWRANRSAIHYPIMIFFMVSHWSRHGSSIDPRHRFLSTRTLRGPSAVCSVVPPPRCSSGRPEHIVGSSPSQPDTPTASDESNRNAVFNGQFTATARSREPSIQHGYPSHAPETGATTLRPVTARAFEGHGPRQGSA